MSESTQPHRFSHEAMAAPFEISIAGAELAYARSAARAAFELADQLERELSRYIAHSDISRLARQPAGKPLAIGLDAFACLKRAAAISRDTQGAFDVTVGQLLDYWQDPSHRNVTASEVEFNRLRRLTGMHLLSLDESSHSVTLVRAPVSIDLGGLGKGYAVDRMADLLKEWDIGAALLHGGRSTAFAWGAAGERDSWQVSVSTPITKQLIRRFTLDGRALSGSGTPRRPHILDPRTGRFAKGHLAAWCLAPTAALADALLTAFMVMDIDAVARYVQQRADVQAIVVPELPDGGEGKPIVLGENKAT